jgi:hypothetical protein
MRDLVEPGVQHAAEQLLGQSATEVGDGPAGAGWVLEVD